MKSAEALEIYKTEMNRFDQTRNIQWKFNIAMWTLISLGISFSSELEKANIGTSKFCILLFIFFIGYFIFAYLTQRSLAASKIISNYILKEISVKDDQISIDIEKTTASVAIKRGWWWIIFQMIATGLLLYLLLILST